LSVISKTCTNVLELPVVLHQPPLLSAQHGPHFAVPSPAHCFSPSGEVHASMRVPVHSTEFQMYAGSIAVLSWISLTKRVEQTYRPKPLRRGQSGPCPPARGRHHALQTPAFLLVFVHVPERILANDRCLPLKTGVKTVLVVPVRKHTAEKLASWLPIVDLCSDSNVRLLVYYCCT